MKIAVDARWIFREISGIGAYTRELISHLAEVDDENEYVLIHNDRSVLDRTMDLPPVAAAPNFRAELFPAGLFSPKSQVLLPGLLRRLGVDVYHSANYMIPLLGFPRNRRGRIGCIATVHDVIPMIFPRHAPRSRKARLYPLYRRLMLETGMRADAIITDSNASRADVIEHLRIPQRSAAKVRTIYCGVSKRFTPLPGGGSGPSASEQAGMRTIFYVGRYDPYKNLAGLVKAVARAIEMCPFPLSLSVAGAPDSRYPEPEQLAAELGIEDRVRWTGYLSDKELLAAYRNADVLVQPSRYEGFGLQVLEAMACGTPVISSDRGSLPEVAGDAAVMVDPDDVEGMAGRIRDVLTDGSLASDLVSKGLRQSARFDWRKTAEETLSVYREFAAGN